MSSTPTGSEGSFKAAAMHKENVDAHTLEKGDMRHEEQQVIDMIEVKRIQKKIDRRLPPIFALIYLLAYLDRTNIGNAKTLNANQGSSLLQSTHMTNYQFVLALMVFLIAYSTFEVPSNLMLKKLSPSVWLPTLTVSFGVLSIGLGFSKNFATITALRFLLGMIESGVFCGMIYHCSFWYRPEQRSLRIATFLCSATLAGAFGGAIAYGVGHMNHVAGLEAWRWLFILEGIPTVVAGLILFTCMPQYPETAKFLTPEEKEIWIRYLGANRSIGNEKFDWEAARAALTNPWLYMHYATYTLLAIPISSLSYFTPSIVAGLGYSGLTSQLFTIIPWGVAYLFSGAAAYYADKYNRRGWTACFSSSLACVGFIISAALPAKAFGARFAMLVVTTSGVFGCPAPLCGWVSSNCGSSSAAALANGMNIMLTGPGLITSVWIYRAVEAPAYPTGHGVNSAATGCACVLMCILTLRYKKLNARGQTINGGPYST